MAESSVTLGGVSSAGYLQWSCFNALCYIMRSGLYKGTFRQYGQIHFQLQGGMQGKNASC